MAINEKTSKRLGKLASDVLRTSRSKVARQLAGSVLTQLPDKHKAKKKGSK